jgi:rare lipoprotein A
VTVSGSGDGITLASHASAMLSNQVTFTGTAPTSDAGATVEIDRLGHQTDWQWAPTVQATIGSDGTFSAVWNSNHIGRFSIRALITQQPAASYAASTLPTVTVTVYRRSIATQYGPGFYNQRTACGRRLRPSTIGVANRTLRCGSQVAIYYRGRTMIVPVIDRGPYANHADWDLTEATGKVLGISGTATIGAVSLPPQPQQP